MDCGAGAWMVKEIVDGVKDETVMNPGYPYNGFVGFPGKNGTITLDLCGTYDLNSFLVWNDINIEQEGINTFRLDFFDDSESLLSSTGILIAPAGQLTVERFDFASTVCGVGRVDLVVLSLHQLHIEIRGGI